MEPVINSPLVICQRNAAEARARVPIADPKPDNFRDFDKERERTALIFVECRSDAFRKDFAEYLSENYHVYQAFEREANKVWDLGRRHYSGRTIIEVLRHESALTDRGELFKLNDWWTPDLCRLWMMMNPNREGFFETRKACSAKRAL